MEYKGIDLKNRIYKIESLSSVERIFFRHYDELYYSNLLQESPLFVIENDFELYLIKPVENKQSLVIESINNQCDETQLLFNLGFGPIIDEVSLKDLIQFYFPV